MASENRTPDDLQEAVAATLRRLRGEVGKTGTAAPAPQQRIEPQLSVQPPAQEILPAAAGEAPPPPPPPLVAEPDLLSRAEPEIPPAPTPRASIRETLASGREPQPPRGSMRLVPYALSFAAIVVFAGIVWWAYQAVVGGQKNGPVPVIAADNTPAKVAPSDQSASDTSGQQQTVYDQISGGTANQPKPEVLLPAPDTPQTPPPPPTPTPSASDISGGTTTAGTTNAASGATGTDTGSTNTTTAATGSTTSTTTGTDTSGTTTQTLIPPPAPLAPSTTGTASTGTTTGTDTGTTTTADAGTTATTGATTGATAGGTTSTDSGSVNTNASTDAGPAPYEVPTLSPLSGSATAPDVTAPAAATAPATTTTSTDTTTSADAGSAATTGTVADNYRIQLAAVKSQADADKAWKRILAKHSDVLGSLTVHIVRADLGTQGIYYRVQAGPFADKASAQSVCDQLKSSGQQCLVKP